MRTVTLGTLTPDGYDTSTGNEPRGPISVDDLLAKLAAIDASDEKAKSAGASAAPEPATFRELLLQFVSKILNRYRVR